MDMRPVEGSPTRTPTRATPGFRSFGASRYNAPGSGHRRRRVAHVLPGERDGAHALGQLDLEDHAPPMAEADFADAQIELPHPAEPLVVERGDLVAVSGEASAP